MELRILIILIILLCKSSWAPIFGQTAFIQGIIYSEGDEPLPYASIYSKKTDIGTSSDDKGHFAFTIGPGQDEIVFQYLGYQQYVVDVNLEPNDTLKLDVRLKSLSLDLDQVTVAGDRNPADEIMREVMQRRARFEELSNQHEAGVYIKGVYRVKDAPESVFGFQVGGVDSILEGLPSDIVYLSETQSIYARLNEQTKEKVLASKTSGMSSLPSINRASTLDVNFYDSSPKVFDRTTKSPLANGGFSHYNYSYLGQYTTDEGDIIHQIGVTPRRPGDSLFDGYIEIVDGRWVLNAVNLYINGRRLNMEFLDSVQIRQNFIDQQAAPIPPAVQTDYRITASAFGFLIRGGFTGVKNNFNFNPDSFRLDFDRTLLSYAEDALVKDSSFWTVERPIALTGEERTDYQFKDSIELELNDPERIDSLEDEQNKFQPINLLTGYNYRKSRKGISWSINSPLTALFYNPVQGWNGGIDARFRKDRKKGQRIHSSFESFAQLQYGTSDKEWRSWGEMAYKTGDKRPLRIKVAGGFRLNQIPRERPVSLNANQFSNLFFKTHYIRFYDQRFLRLSWTKNFGAGLRWFNQFNFERRSIVNNTSNYSFFRKNRVYPENIPLHSDVLEDLNLWTDHNAFILKGRWTYRPGLRYVELPQTRIEIPGKWPQFGFSYTWGINRWSTRADFLQLEVDINYDYQFGIAGYSNWVVKAGGFVRDRDITFFDYRHFAGNAFYISKGDYRETFLNLPYYQFSTRDNYIESHWLHNFQGYLLNKVPGINRLGFALEIKGSYLHHADIGHYNEFSLGIDRIGWGLFRLFRLDYVVSLRDGKYAGSRLIFGSQFSFDDLRQEGTSL